MRLVGVDIPNNKHVLISLTYIHGIGLKSAANICKQANVESATLVRNLNTSDLNKITAIINDDYVVEGDLRKKVYMDIRLLIDIGCYRGRRHYNKLPVRGQRTRTNAKTRKGKSVAIANKKKI